MGAPISACSHMRHSENASTDLQAFIRLILHCREIGDEWMLSVSVSELPILYSLENFNDFDLMFYEKKTFAIEANTGNKQPRNFKRNRATVLLNIDTHGCHPGFSRLRRKEGRLLHHNPGDDLVPTHGRSRKYKSFNDFLRPAFLDVNDDYSVDYVKCVYCPNWPSVAERWLSRKRTNGWPPKELTKKIVSAGCHLVRKAHPSHSDDKTEWRFSFSRAETVLVTSWTQHQIYIYHVLRLIKKSLIAFCGGQENTILSTYHFKTAMLWACEEKSKNFWNEQNLVSSVKEILLNLVECLIDKKISNFFIPARVTYLIT